MTQCKGRREDLYTTAVGYIHQEGVSVSRGMCVEEGGDRVLDCPVSHFTRTLRHSGVK